MIHRTKHYKRTTFKDEQATTELCKFTEAQATEGGGVLETDGLSLHVAVKLCEKWNRLGSIGPIFYDYSIPFVTKFS